MVAEELEKWHQVGNGQHAWIDWVNGDVEIEYGVSPQRPDNVAPGWTFYDHLLLGWYSEWQERLRTLD